jgi:hypothetical protein
MTALHPSEHRVGTLKFCRRCNKVHLFPRYQASPPTLDKPLPLVRLLNLLLASVAFWLVIIAIVLNFASVAS